MDNFHVGDVGTFIELTVSTSGSPANLASATTKQIWLTKPQGGTKIVKTAVFSTDGTDGKIRYTWLANDLDQDGTWKAEAYIVISSVIMHSSITSFDVEKILV